MDFDLLQEICQYQGSIRGIPESWVALSTCDALKGVIFDGENLHYIQPQEQSLDSDHYLYRHNDLVANKSCGEFLFFIIPFLGLGLAGKLVSGM